MSTVSDPGRPDVTHKESKLLEGVPAAASVEPANAQSLALRIRDLRKDYFLAGEPLHRVVEF